MTAPQGWLGEILKLVRRCHGQIRQLDLQGVRQTLVEIEKALTKAGGGEQFDEKDIPPRA